MSKELEQVLQVFDYITGDSKEFNSVEIGDKLVDIKIALHRLKRLETPPTADEVCKALSEYLEEDVMFTGIVFVGKFDICYINKNDTLTFEYDLPPHLITLIGRFYEGESK